MSFSLDEVTQKDLTLFDREEPSSVFEKFNFTQTLGGEQYLEKIFSSPSNNSDILLANQELIKVLLRISDQWPTKIGSGTIFVLERFCAEYFAGISPKDSWLSRAGFQLANRDQYSVLKFSVKIASEFFSGLQQLQVALSNKELPAAYKQYKILIDQIFEEAPIRELAAFTPDDVFTSKQIFYFGYHLRVQYKKQMLTLLQIFCEMEAWHTIALAMTQYRLVFPEFVEEETPFFEAKGLFHLMLDGAKGYDVSLTADKGLLLLTGSNMAGKSTFIKAVGLSLFLAHLGIGVPAVAMKLSTFDGLSTHLNVADDINKGQSYFLTKYVI